MVGSIKTTKDYSREINTLNEDLRGEVKRLRTEMTRKPAQMMVYPINVEERTKLVFKGLENDNPIELLLNCE